MSKVQLVGVKIIINGMDIELTIAEAKELQRELNNLFLQPPISYMPPAIYEQNNDLRILAASLPIEECGYKTKMED